MWLCADCRLAQLADRVRLPEDPVGLEPSALAAQRAAASTGSSSGVRSVPGDRVAEFGSPHGGSFAGPLTGHGLVLAGHDEPADVVLDGCFGLMHARRPGCRAAPAVARLRPGGRLVLQFHSLAAVLRGEQWKRTAARARRLLLDAGAGRPARPARAHRDRRPLVPAVRRHGCVWSRRAPRTRLRWAVGRPSSWPVCSGGSARPGCTTWPRCAGCRPRSAAPAGEPAGVCTGRTRPRGPGLRLTARRPGRSRCSTSRACTRGSCSGSPTPRPRSRAAGCRAARIPVIPPAELVDRTRTSCSCSCPSCWPRHERHCRASSSPAGRWVDAAAARLGSPHRTDAVAPRAAAVN